MEIRKLISSILLATAASSAFALTNQEIVTLLNKDSNRPIPNLYHSKQNDAALNWKSLYGPRTGNNVKVIQLKNNSSTLFAFSNSILYKSNDGGKNWTALPAPKNINDLIAIDDNRLILAAKGRIYTSADQGEHWLLSADIDAYCEKLFALNPNLILLETNTRSAIASVYRSLDGGKTWTPARLGLNLRSSGAWGISGRDNLLVISTNGLYISTNGGELWTQPEKWKNLIAYSLAVTSKHDVFVATSNLYKTDITGQAWKKINTDSIGRVYEVQIDSQDRIYVIGRDTNDGLYRSTDDGKTWELLQKFSEIKSFSLLDNGKIIVSTRDGLMQSNEDQQHFNKLPISFSASTTEKVFALDENNIFAIDNNLYSTNDAGKNWEMIRSTRAIDVTGFNHDIVELEWDKSGNGQHLLTSADHGKTWQEAKFPDTKTCHTLSNQNDALILSCDGGHYLTRDLIHWKMINSEERGASSYVIGQTIYTSNGDSIKLSNDEGKTWITLMDNLNHYGTHISGYQNKVVLVAIFAAGIIKTKDSGASWELINDGITDFYFTGFTAVDENNYVATTGSGVFITQDGGKHWTRENSGLDNFDINSLFANKNMIVVGTAGSGVFKASFIR